MSIAYRLPPLGGDAVSRNQALINALAVAIKTRRRELGMTQEGLAGRAELDGPFISLTEVRRRQPSLSVLHRLALALDLSLQEFAQRIEQRFKVEFQAAELRRS